MFKACKCAVEFSGENEGCPICHPEVHALHDILTCDVSSRDGNYVGCVVRGDEVLHVEPVVGDTNEAELRAVLLATRYATYQRGVILTDSTSAVKAMSQDLPWHPRARNPLAWRKLAIEVRDAVPDGWLVAWIPRRLNKKAHTASRRLESDRLDEEQAC